MNLTRRSLLLTEMDAALRGSERAAHEGDPVSIKKHWIDHMRAGRDPKDFFAKELEEYHKAHDEHRRATAHFLKKGYNPEKPEAWDAKAFDKAQKRRNTAKNAIEAKGQALATKAHLVDHPVGQYLDKKRVPAARTYPGGFEVPIHDALHHVSHDPSVSRPHNVYGGYNRGHGGQFWDNGNEASARHLEHGLKAHGLDDHMRRAKRNPLTVVTGEHEENVRPG